MDLFVRNTISGLVPLYPSDQDEKKKLKLGQDYKCTITQPRNIGFHRKAFALFNVGHQNTKLELPFDVYRKIMTMRSGYFNSYQTDKGVHYEATSLSFGSMDEDTFQEVYSRVLDAIIKDIGATSEDIEKSLIEFM